jgi:hypothetical protein
MDPRGCQGVLMSDPSRPVQPATYHGVPCWLLAAEQLTDAHLGHMCFGTAPEGLLVSFGPSARDGVLLTLDTPAGLAGVSVPRSNQLLVVRDRPHGVPGSSLAPGTYRITTATGSAYELAIGVEASVLTRHPREFDLHPSVDGLVPRDLRRDREALGVERIIQFEVGSPAVFILDVRRDGVSTIRTISPVLSIDRIECRE